MFDNVVCLAPMVRAGALPLRILCLDYGADLVWSEEIIDRKLSLCRRVENGILGTIDYVLNEKTIIFRTCSAEKGKVTHHLIQ